MSSECRCHTDEWCFYCEMYSPLERKYEDQRKAIERVIAELEVFKEKCANEGHYSSVITLGYAIDKLEEVLSQHEKPCTCKPGDGTGNAD